MFSYWLINCKLGGLGFKRKRLVIQQQQKPKINERCAIDTFHPSVVELLLYSSGHANIAEIKSLSQSGYNSF